MAKLISVSDELKEELEIQKDEEGHTSLDSLIRILRSESDMYRIIKSDYEALKKKLEECEKRRKA